jgi:hypothetical protein
MQHVGKAVDQSRQEHKALLAKGDNTAQQIPVAV